MDADKLEFFKKRLLEEREGVLKIIERIDTSWSKTLRESVGDISAYATHIADLATDYNERERDSYILERSLQNLKRIDQALRRIYDGTYGKCLYCGKEISEKRLVSIPDAEFCIECKRNTERINHRYRKTS